MTIVLQKSDLAAASFANTNSNGAGGVALRTDAGSAFRAELALNTGAGLVGFIQPGAGAVPRTLQSKGEDVLSVKDYASLQEAVNAAAAPTVGTWTAGDTVYISAPTAGGNIGHVCVTGGTPGTRKTFGAISN
jgi:hypothetical protein